MATDTKNTWIWTGWILGALLLPAVVLWGCPKLWTDHQTAIRSAGGILQMLGVALVVWGVAEDVLRAGLLPSRAALRKRLHSWWMQSWWRRILRRPPSTVLDVHPLHHGATIQGLGVELGGRPHVEGPIEDRVAFLEKQLESDVKRLEAMDARLHQRIDQERKWARTELAGLKETLGDVSCEVQLLPVRGARKALAGAWWVFTGVFVQTWL